MVSELFNVRNMPVPDFSESVYHPGVDALLGLLGENGFKIYRSEEESRLAGPRGLIAGDDLVVLKVNGRWK